MTVEQVDAAKVYPLRLLVLRPGGKIEDCIFAGDDDHSTIHFACYTDQRVMAGIASFYCNGHELINARSPVQLRGMATHPDHRGAGYGKSIVEHALQFFAERQADVMWCNAREVARTFYERLGFEAMGAPFDIKGIGKHWLMYRPIQS